MAATTATVSNSTLKLAILAGITQLPADTLLSRAPSPITEEWVTTGGVQVIVPAGRNPGDTVLLNSDGTAPTVPLVEGVNIFTVADAAKDLITISGVA